MQLDRPYQRRLLAKMAEVYPDPLRLRPATEELFETLSIAMSDQSDNDRILSANLAYLEEHGLAKVERMFRHNSLGRPVSSTITVRGLDFLSDDGGLSAILGVVTVKLDEETLRTLLLNRVEREEEAPNVKENMRNAILEMPSSILQQVVSRVLDSAFDEPGKIIRVLRELLPLTGLNSAN